MGHGACLEGIRPAELVCPVHVINYIEDDARLHSGELVVVLLVFPESFRFSKESIP